MQKQRELMQEELKRSTEKTLSAEERAQQMDQMLSDEEARVAQLEKEMAAYREKQVREILSMHPRNLWTVCLAPYIYDRTCSHVLLQKLSWIKDIFGVVRN